MATFLSSALISLLGSFLLPRLSSLNIHVLHAMPGRVRLQCNNWKGKDVAEKLSHSLQQHPLVEQASASPVTGSLLLHFTNEYLSREQFDEIVNFAVQVTKVTIEHEKSTATLQMSRMVGGLNRRLKVVTNGALDLPALMVFAMATQAIRGFGNSRGNSMQQLFWVYRLLRGEGGKQFE